MYICNQLRLKLPFGWKTILYQPENIALQRLTPLSGRKR